MSMESLKYSVETSPQIEVYFMKYSNNNLLVITQLNKLGLFIMARCENPEAEKEDRVYEAEVRFGDRCDEWSQALARGIIEKLGLNALVLIVSVVTKDAETYKLILQSFDGKILKTQEERREEKGTE